MRRIIYEIDIGEGRFLAGPLSQAVKSVEVLDILRFDRNDISLICKVWFKSPKSSGEKRLFDDEMAEVQKLDEDRNGICTFFVRRKLPDPPEGVNPRLVYLTTPWKVENGIGRATFLGSKRQIKSMLNELHKAGIAYRIISLADARFSETALLSVLTEKQCEVVSKAFQEGYYDIPRRIHSDELAVKLGMRNATFVAHRRKAERRLLAEILGES